MNLATRIPRFLAMIAWPKSWPDSFKSPNHLLFTMSTIWEEQTRERARMLARAHLERLRLTVERIPVGSISVTEEGVIDSVDKETERRATNNSERMHGHRIDRYLNSNATWFEIRANNRKFGYVGKASLRTFSGGEYSCELAIAQGIKLERLDLAFLYTQEVFTDFQVPGFPLYAANLSGIDNFCDEKRYRSTQYSSTPYTSSPYISSRVYYCSDPKSQKEA